MGIWRWALVAAVLVAGCRKKQPRETHAAKALVVDAGPSETPLADRIVADEADVQWLAGTWKQEGSDRWFLFNLPSDVMELGGKPVHVIRRGKLVIRDLECNVKA